MAGWVDRPEVVLKVCSVWSEVMAVMNCELAVKATTGRDKRDCHSVSPLRRAFSRLILPALLVWWLEELTHSMNSEPSLCDFETSRECLILMALRAGMEKRRGVMVEAGTEADIVSCACCGITSKLMDSNLLMLLVLEMLLV